MRQSIVTGSSFLDTADINTHIQDVAVAGEALCLQSGERRTSENRSTKETGKNKQTKLPTYNNNDGIISLVSCKAKDHEWRALQVQQSLVSIPSGGTLM